MATCKMIVNVVDVGQGQCTFVELYDLFGNLTHTLLFDCGSDKKSPLTLTNIEYVADKIESMSKPALDLLLFSHSDNDHVSLMKNLLELCVVTKPTIKNVVYGGNWDNYTKGRRGGQGVNILTYLVTNGYCNNADIFGPPPNFSGFDRDKKEFKGALWNTDNIRVDLLVGNVLSDDPKNPANAQVVPKFNDKESDALNRVSLICSVTYEGHTYIICGDATNSCMGWVNYYLETPRFSLVPMITLPHHGSRNTGLDTNTGSKKSEAVAANDTAIATVKTFAKICSAKTVTASSFTKHGHPSMELAQYFLDPLAPKPLVRDAREAVGVDAHSMVSYVDLLLKRTNNDPIGQYEYQTYHTETNLFGTNYYNATFPTTFAYNYRNPSNKSVEDTPKGLPPPLNTHACWVYGNDKQGNEELLGVRYLPPSTGIVGTIFTERVSGNKSVAADVAAALPQSKSKRAIVVPSLARLRHFR
jgi:hypothetical protein